MPAAALLFSAALTPGANAAPGHAPAHAPARAAGTVPGVHTVGAAGQKPKPPRRMSTVGGDRLGRSGTQVSPKSGGSGGKAPAVPSGLSARSWVVSDAESGEVLASHNAHWRLPPASTLKMLFADTVLPKFPKTTAHKVKRSDLNGMGEGSSLVGVQVGQKYTVRDLWRGVFLRSGNDAVHVLAHMNGGVGETVSQMNEKAKKLHASDTHVVTPDGYDEKGQLSSAYDLSLFARSGMQNADFRDYASTARAKFPGEKKKGKKRGSFAIQNTNRLLSGDVGMKPYPGIAGVKNGSTTNAGNTFTGIAQHGDRVLLVTVMHPEKAVPLEVYKEAEKLLDWGFSAAGKVQPVGRLAAPGSSHHSATTKGAGDGKEAAGQAGGAAAAGETKGATAGGVGVAFGITGGCIVIVAAVAYAVHRRWPLAGNRLRRRPPGA